MEDLIRENSNLIYSVTKYFERYGNKEDLYQAGCIGMMLAYKNYDSNQNVKFTTYAYPYILGEMKKLVREDKTIKISRGLQMLNLKIERATILLAQQFMREPTVMEIADYLEVPEYMVAEALGSTKSICSIDEPIVRDGKEVTLHDTIGQIDMATRDDLLALKEELSNLTPFERELIEKRYMEDLTQQQTAQILGMSQVQVSRKEQKVLCKLKDKLVA